jgi:glyoxylate reductase
MAEPAPPYVLVTRYLPAGSLDPLADAGVSVQEWTAEEPIPRAHLLAEARRCDGLLVMITERVDQELLDAAPRLKVVATFGVGYDHVDVAACTRRGVAVCNTPGVLVETTADLAFALLMAAARRLVEGTDAVKTGQWGPWNPWFMLGRDVHHATLGIVGLGAIGAQVARRARGFDMRVLYTSRTRKPELEQRLGVEFVDFDTLLRESDFVSLHVPLTSATRHLVAAPQLAAMKQSAVLINTARGAVVDQAALYEACASGTIAGAALDVTDPEPLPPDHRLLTLPNVTVVPHVGSATLGTRVRMGRLAAEGIAAVLGGRRPPAIVNPEVLAVQS